MWKRLSGWGRVRAVFITAVSLFMAALSFTSGSAWFGVVALGIPVVLGFEIWGEQNRSRRGRPYWLLLAGDRYGSHLPRPVDPGLRARGEGAVSYPA